PQQVSEMKELHIGFHYHFEISFSLIVG
ncbi:unnamed protein product, partial [Rotaria sp. Silwood2]